jgi:hypothetical protein
MSEVAKTAHEGGQYVQAAAIDKVEHAFAATGIYLYRSNIISDEDSEPSDITRIDMIPDEDLEGTEDGHSDVDSTPPRTPDNTYTSSCYQKVGARCTVVG